MSNWKRSAFLLLMLVAFIPEFFDCIPVRPLECANRFYLPWQKEFSVGRHCEETMHKLDCSVGPRKYIEGDIPLHCRIRRKKGWKAYEKNLGNLSQCHYEDCEPSQLASLRVVRIKYGEYLDEVHTWPTIQLNFTVPKVTVERQFYTGGILMNFSSDSQIATGDYKFESRYRLLDFSNYSYSSPDNDKTHQRILSFPCFIGFQHEPCQSDNYKVYTLTLKSFSNSKTTEGRTTFTKLSYNITIYSYYVYHPDKWKSTIAVAFFPKENDVTVLFDPSPVTVTYYNVSLFNVDVNTTYQYEIIGQSTKHCFKDVMDGSYYISIMVVSEGRTCSGDCKLTKSHVFTVRNLNRITGVINYENNAELIYLSVGCSMGVPVVLAILVVCYCRWRTKKINKKTDQDPLPKVLLIYSNATQECCDIAFEFARFCRENLHIDILNENLNHDNNSVTIETNSSPWYRDKLSKSSAAIILWTPLHKPKENEDHGDADEIKSVVKLAVESQCKNGLKIICIYFDIRHKRSIPNNIQTKARLFHFPKKLDEFCTYILGHKMLRDTTIRNELKTLIRRFSLNTRYMYMETKFQHVISHHDSVSDEETKDTDRILDHVMRHEGLASKSDGNEAQPLIHHDDLRKKSSENHFVSSDINKQCSKQRSQCSKTLAIVHRQIQTPCDSKSTLERFGSGELPNSKIPCQSSRDRFSECTNLSDLSVSCLKFRMMDITSDDNSSQSSGYAHCDPVSPFSSSTPEYESGVSLISRIPHHYERLQPMEADYDFISDNKDIHSDSDDNSIVHCTTHPMSPRQTIIQDRTISYFDKYSLSSGSVRSSEIDLSEFLLPDGIS